MFPGEPPEDTEEEKFSEFWLGVKVFLWTIVYILAMYLLLKLVVNFSHMHW